MANLGLSPSPHEHLPMTALPQDTTPPSSPEPTANTEDRRVDLKIVAVLFGCTVLLTAVIARYTFDSKDYADLLAMAAALLLGLPIVFGALKSLLPGDRASDQSDAGAGVGDEDQGPARSDSHMEELVSLAIIASFALFLTPDGSGRPLLSWEEATRAPRSEDTRLNSSHPSRSRMPSSA